MTYQAPYAARYVSAAGNQIQLLNLWDDTPEPPRFGGSMEAFETSLVDGPRAFAQGLGSAVEQRTIAFYRWFTDYQDMASWQENLALWMASNQNGYLYLQFAEQPQWRFAAVITGYQFETENFVPPPSPEDGYLCLLVTLTMTVTDRRRPQVRVVVGAVHPPDVVQAFPIRERRGRQRRSRGRLFPRCTVHRSSFSLSIPFLFFSFLFAFRRSVICYPRLVSYVGFRHRFRRWFPASLPAIGTRNFSFALNFSLGVSRIKRNDKIVPVPVVQSAGLGYLGGHDPARLHPAAISPGPGPGNPSHVLLVAGPGYEGKPGGPLGGIGADVLIGADNVKWYIDVFHIL